MKMNLIVLSKNKRLSKQLSGYVEKDNVDKCREFLARYFPTNSFLHAHDRLVLEMADLVVSLCGDPDIEDTLTEYSECVQDIITRYHRQKDEASKTLSRVYRQSNANYVHMSRKERAAIGYTPETVDQLLRQLDAREIYSQFTEGYEFERYQIHEWLRYYINEALAGITHTVASKKKRRKSRAPAYTSGNDMYEREELSSIEKHPWDDIKSSPC